MDDDTPEKMDALYSILYSNVHWYIVWRAAHDSSRLTRRQWEQVPLLSICIDLNQLTTLKRPWLTLRVFAILLCGLVKVLEKQTYYVYSDVKNVWVRFQMTFSKLEDPTHSKPAKMNQVTLIDPLLMVTSFTDPPSISDITILPESEFFSLNCEEDIEYTVIDQRDITMSEDFLSESILYEIPGDCDFDGSELSYGPIPVLDGTPMPQPTMLTTPTPPRCTFPLEATPTLQPINSNVSEHHRTPRYNEDIFVSPLPEVDMVPLGKPGKAKRKLAFDAVIELTEKQLKRVCTSRRANNFHKKIAAKILLSEPCCSTTRQNMVLWDLWKRNSFELTDFDCDDVQHLSTITESLFKSDVEVLRAGSSYNETARDPSWANATPFSTDVSGGIISINYSSEFDFITSSTQRTLERMSLAPLGHLSPIIDADEYDDNFPLDNISIESAGLIETDTNAFFSCVVVKNFREKVQVQFSDLLPFPQCTKLTAAMTFSRVLGLLTKGVLNATQQEPYASIVLTRGNNF